MNRRFEWIFFDLDGTLAESLQALFGVYRDFLGELGLEGSKEEFEKLNGPSPTEIVHFLISKYDLKADPELLTSQYRMKIREAYEHTVLPKNGSANLLNKLTYRGYQLLLVTSAERETALGFLKRENWSHYFRDFVFGDEIKKAKPVPEIYERALKKAGSPPEAVVVVEDSPKGIESASRAGLSVVGVASDSSRKEQLLKSGAHCVIFELSEMLEFLGERN